YTFTPNAGQCATTATLTITVNPANTVPTFTAIQPICFGQTLNPLPTTSNNGITGTWSPALNNSATTTYTFTPNAGQCATTATLTITVNPANTVPTFTAIQPICFGQTLNPLPTTSNNGITGTWSPALNNLVTTTYTFTPTTGQCASTATLTINVNTPVVPIFTAVAPICLGENLSALPLISNNGITGSWSPALDNSATTTYTFTPTTGQCASTVTMTINVNTSIVPTFTAVASICLGENLSALPLTSNNGIIGTWSPALNNSATTTYTFTPNAGQCATTATLTITVNPSNTVPTFTAIQPICFGQTLNPLPTTSNNGITGTWSPALNNSATTTYTFTPNAGQCGTVTTLTITVNNLVVPTFTSVAPICQGETLSALPLTSNNGITGTWSPALNDSATTTYTFTPNVGQCASTVTMTINVNTPIVPTFTAVASICLGENLSALPLASNNGITGTWSPALNNSATTTYTFTPNAGQCASTATMTINVNTPIVPTFTAVASICLGENLSALPLTSNNGIIGTWSPALNDSATTTYTFTPNVGQCATTATLTITVNPANTVPTFTAIQPICFGQTLNPLPTTSNNGITGTWSPALNNSATTTYIFTPNAGQCGTITTLTITVNNLVVPTFTSVATICQGETLSALPLTSNNGITGTWSPALNNLVTTTYTFTPTTGQCASTATLTINVNTPVVPIFTAVASICLGENLSALPLISNNGITGTWSPALDNSATTTYTFTPNAGQCASTATMTINVNTPIVPTFTAVASICLGENLSALPLISNNGITGTWSPALNNLATTIYTFTPNSGQCATGTTLTVTVNTINVIPDFATVAPICSGQAIAPLPTTSINGITGTWSPALNNSATTTYTFTPNTGQCATATTMTIIVDTSIVPTFTSVAPICQGETLSALPLTSNNGITGTWSPALNNLATTTYTFTPNAGQCATTATLTITITDKITPVFTISPIFCIGSTPSSLDTVSDNGISGTWNPSVITASGNYVFTPSANQCALPYTLTITSSEIDFEITEGCTNGAFLLQASPLSNSFDPDTVSYQWKNSSGAAIGSDEKELNVTALLNSTPEIEEFPITYELTITNDSGCFKTRRVEIFGAICKIPKGISPNNDGANDDWDLTGLGVKHVTIFNRYGTEVFTHRNYTNQWKGQSNKGDELPDATYFYVIEQENGPNLTGWVYINKAY
ncbi:gliding motility-associated-like protein, partial [Flavobacterium arsenatis]